LIARKFLAEPIPEHDLERRQLKQCNPNLRINGSLFVVGLNDVERRTRRFSEPGDSRVSSRGVRSVSRFDYIA
jgi:hypothetical protein